MTERRAAYRTKRPATWKATERAVAKHLGGQRVSKHGQGEATPDVQTGAFSVEVKHREALPQWLVDAMDQAVRNAATGTMPLVVLHEAGRRHVDDFIIARMSDFVAWFGGVDVGEGKE